ncbi:MAG: DUF6799 domain-containing protein [Candidatus Binataceae bacterium]
MPGTVAAIACIVSAFALIIAAPLCAAQSDQGVIMQKGTVMKMDRGKPMAPMKTPMVMSNGAKVMPNGMVKMKGGGEKHLKNGQMMMMDGYVMQGGKARAMEK